MNILNNIRSKEEIIEITIFVRLNLYNSLAPCGAKAIREKMKSMDVEPLPSLSTINRILRENYLTHRRMGYSPEDYRKDYIHYKKSGAARNTFLKLERAYRANGEAIFCGISSIRKFIKFLWKKEDFML